MQPASQVWSDHPKAGSDTSDGAGPSQRERALEDWHDVCGIAELPRGGMRAVEVDGRAILVCHVAEGWFAVDGVCTHAEARLSEGWLRGCRLQCPLHGAAFDIRDGRVLGPPAFHWLATHRVRVNGARVEILVTASG